MERLTDWHGIRNGNGIDYLVCSSFEGAGRVKTAEKGGDINVLNTPRPLDALTIHHRADRFDRCTQIPPSSRAHPSKHHPARGLNVLALLLCHRRTPTSISTPEVPLIVIVKLAPGVGRSKEYCASVICTGDSGVPVVVNISI